MVLNSIPLIFAIALSLIHFLSKKISKKIEKYHQHLISLSAGIFITYIILVMLPEVTIGSEIIGEHIYLALLGGYSFFHLIEKYTYQHYKNKKKLIDELAHLHMFGFVFDSFVVGFTLVIFYKISTPFTILAILPIIPYALHSLASSLSLEHIHEKFASKKVERFFLSLSPLFGAVVATIIQISESQFYLIFGFLLGILIYIVTRNTMPEGKKGVPGFFLIGIILTLLLLGISNFPI